ncbi:MAG: TonB-dependent receptor [Balneolales bacterium]
MRFVTTLFLFIIVPFIVLAQEVSVSGTVTEEQNDEVLIGANVAIYTESDTSLVGGASTDSDGIFLLTNITPEDYILTVTYLGYNSISRSITIGEGNITDLGISMEPGNQVLADITVTAQLPPVEVRGDTTQFNSGAFRLNEDASAEDLILRMPGFIIEDGEVRAQGEEVQRVLVDGEEFFGDDARIALRNLPAEIIDKIEVYDRQSDQASFTGFDDDDAEKTVNIVTKPGMNTGRFGRGEAGLGTDTRYMSGGNMNYFRGNRRVSLIGLSNNINQLNFSTEDMQDVSGGRGGRGRGRGRGGGGYNTGGQNGINIVHSLGLNYIDQWNDQWEANGSYFFNARSNTNEVERERRYIMAQLEDQRYNEESFSDSDNYNHRMNMRMEYEINDNNSMVFRTGLGATENESLSLLDALTLSPDNTLINEVLNESINENRSFNLSQSGLYRHRLAKEGRTFSANFRGNLNRNSGDRYLLGETIYYEGTDQSVIDDRLTDIYSNSSGVSVDFAYTEPLGEDSQLMFDYNPSWDRDRSDRGTWLSDDETGEYNDLDTLLTNRYENDLYQQRGGVRFRSNIGRTRANISLDYQHTLLQGEQDFPFEADTRQTYNNLMPRAGLGIDITEGSSLHINYSTRTRTPSASQLQNVIDNSNRLRLRGGNPDLRQQYSHSIRTRFRMTDRERGSSTFLSLSATRTDDYISQRTYVAQNDSIVQEGVILRAGSQLVVPENVGTSWNYSAYASRGLPINALKSNLNLNAGANYTHTPVYVNDDLSQTKRTGVNAGLSFSSNISRQIDFRVNYSGSYQFVDQENQASSIAISGNNYYTGRAGANFNLETGFGLTFSTNYNLRHNHGLGDDFSPTTMYWNLSAGYKFLPNKAAQLKITAIDLLNRNDDINRTVSENYVEDVRSDVLSRYFLMTLSYRFRSFPEGEREIPR